MTPFDVGAGDVREYLEIFRRRRWIIVACALAGAALAVAYSLSQQKVYESSAVLLFQSANSSGLVREGSAGSELTQAAAAQVEVQLFDSRAVQDAAADKLGESADVKAAILDEAVGLEVIATASSPVVAAKAANVYAQAYSDARVRSAVEQADAARSVLREQLSEVDSRLTAVQAELRGDAGAPQGENQTESQLTDELTSLSAQKSSLEDRLDALALIGAGDGPQIVSPAEPNGSPTSPKPVRNLLAGFVAGLVVGLALALVRERLDDAVRTEGDLQEIAAGLPVLATLPHIKVRGRTDFIAITNPTGRGVVEPLRTVRTALQYVSIDRPINRLLIASPTPGDGKSTLALNIALAYGRAGKRTVLIDADLRRPRLSRFVDNPRGCGLTSVLLGETQLEDSVLRVAGEANFALLPTGPTPPGSSEIFESDRTRAVLDAIGAQADMVVFDAPPLLTIADALTLAQNVDAVLLVARSGKTSKRDVRAALERLGQVGAPVVGLVLNDSRRRSSYNSYYYDEYAADDLKDPPPTPRSPRQAKGVEQAWPPPFAPPEAAG